MKQTKPAQAMELRSLSPVFAGPARAGGRLGMAAEATFLEVVFQAADFTFGVVHPILIIFLAAVGAGGLFTLAHRIGLLAEREPPSILTLSEHDSEASSTGDRARPIVPK